MNGRPASKGITPWMGEEQELLYKLYKENQPNREISRIINKTFHKGKEVRNPESVKQYILFAIEKGWLEKTRTDESIWSKEELARCVTLASDEHCYSKQEIAEKLNQEFHGGRQIRLIRSIEYGLNLAFEKGYDPIVGAEEHGDYDL